ncbi:hypothetical protein A2U01_0030344, partial [Trifolium medium]|nr:hypothetical protein [Trifolium medium]
MGRIDMAPMVRQVVDTVTLNSGTEGKGTCRNINTLTFKSAFER